MRDTSFAEQYKQHAQPNLDKMRTAVMQLRALAALRDKLLSKLSFGDLRLPDTERIVGRAI